VDEVGLCYQPRLKDGVIDGDNGDDDDEVWDWRLEIVNMTYLYGVMMRLAQRMREFILEMRWRVTKRSVIC